MKKSLYSPLIALTFLSLAACEPKHSNNASASDTEPTVEKLETTPVVSEEQNRVFEDLICDTPAGSLTIGLDDEGGNLPMDEITTEHIILKSVTWSGVTREHNLKPAQVFTKFIKNDDDEFVHILSARFLNDEGVEVLELDGSLSQLAYTIAEDPSNRKTIIVESSCQIPHNN